MSSHFQPAAPTGQHCWHCAYFVALVYRGTAARCAQGGRLSIQAAPTTGCAFWLREIGADDEPGPPDSGDVIAAQSFFDRPAEVAWAP